MPFGKKKSLSYDGELNGDAANSADDVREDDVKASSPPATAASPVINFSIDGAHVQKNPGRPSKDDYSRLLSALYALVLILVGFLLPLTEALNENWNSSLYNLVFQIYIFSGGIFFLSYLLFFLVPQSNRINTDSGQETFDAATVVHTKSGIIIQDANAPPPPKRKKRHHKKESDTLGNSKKSLHKSSSRGMVRVSVSASNLNSADADQDYASARLGGGENTLNLSGGLSEWDVGEASLVDDHNSNTVYRDISTFGSAFSHDGSSLYLRFGALIFCVCNIIYISLEIENGSRPRVGCDNTSYWWIFIFRLVFLLIQSFFLFKNNHVVISTRQPLARFGFMHLLATNMCVWLHTIIHEIMNEYFHLKEMQSQPNTTDTLPHFISPDESSNVVKPLDCAMYSGILKSAAPYLFPFVLEYSLIAIGSVAIMYSAIAESEHNGAIRMIQNWIQVQALSQTIDENDPSHVTGGDHSNNAHVQLAKSHRGLFAGMLVLSGSLVSVFMFYFFTQQKDIIYYITDLSLHSCLLLAAVFALYNLHKMAYVAKPLAVDDVLLLIAMCGSFLYELSLILPSASYIEGHPPSQTFTMEVLTLCSASVAAVQTFLQVLLVISGMRRYPNKVELVRDMPGRGTITFLIIGNVAVWLERTMQTKEVSHDTEISYYGLLAALLLLNINLPLLLFFRFHSSICLADIWEVAYTPLHKKMHHAAASNHGGNDFDSASHHGGGRGFDAGSQSLSVSHGPDIGLTQGRMYKKNRSTSIGGDSIHRNNSTTSAYSAGKRNLGFTSDNQTVSSNASSPTIKYPVISGVEFIRETSDIYPIPEVDDDSGSFQDAPGIFTLDMFDRTTVDDVDDVTRVNVTPPGGGDDEYPTLSDSGFDADNTYQL